MTDMRLPVDPLGEALHYLRMDGVFYTRSEFTAPWGLELPALPNCLMFHVVTAGRCWLNVTGAELSLLNPGDFALIPHGEGHQLLSAPDAAATGLFDLPREQISERYEILRHGGGGAAASIICGAVSFGHPAARRLIDLLPPLIVIEDWDVPHADWIQSTLRMMAAEAGTLRPGGETVITRLADVLVIQVIRAWMAGAPAARAGWLGAMRDRQIGHALALIHSDPARDWTVAALATEVAMSRSAFAARFAELVGEPPMRYLLHWRMQVAQSHIRDGDEPIAELAGRFGYRSEAAFNRAFKRAMGIPPGAVRRGASGRDAG